MLEERQSLSDKGVSALGNVVAFYARSSGKNKSNSDDHLQKEVNPNLNETISEQETPREEMNYTKAINSALPQGIRVLAWTYVDSSFNARFSAKSRSYKYFFVKKGLNIDVSTIRLVLNQASGFSTYNFEFFLSIAWRQRLIF